MELVTIDDIRAAADRIRAFGCARRCCRRCGATSDRPLWIKPENLQPIGAFKVRGAFNAIGAARRVGARPGGVVAYSSGNHAQAVAYAAAVYGIPRAHRDAGGDARHQGGRDPDATAPSRALRGGSTRDGSPPRCSRRPAAS